MTKEEMQRSIEAHHRQLTTVAGLIASLAERLDSHARITRPKDR